MNGVVAIVYANRYCWPFFGWCREREACKKKGEVCESCDEGRDQFGKVVEEAKGVCEDTMKRYINAFRCRESADKVME